MVEKCWQGYLSRRASRSIRIENSFPMLSYFFGSLVSFFVEMNTLRLTNKIQFDKWSPAYSPYYRILLFLGFFSFLEVCSIFHVSNLSIWLNKRAKTSAKFWETSLINHCIYWIRSSPFRIISIENWNCWLRVVQFIFFCHEAHKLTVEWLHTELKCKEPRNYKRI